MRVLLVEPPFERLMGFYRDYYPISLTYLAAVLESEGHEVLVYDAEHSPDTTYLSYKERAKRYDAWLEALEDDDHPVWKEACEVFIDFDPDIVGFSVMTVKFAAALRMAKLVKAMPSKPLVVFGGPHPTILPAQVLEHDDVDIAVRGEGEKTLSELCKAVQNNSSYQHIDGLSWKKDGQITNNPDRAMHENITELPHPARHLLYRIETYNSSDLGLMMTTRGCPFQCTYCSSKCMWGRKVRYRDINDVVDEIEELIKRYGTYQVTFEDDSFTVKRDRVIELCDELDKRKIDIKWSAITRIDLLDDEMLDKMKKAGCDHIRVGVESGSDRILKDIKKGITTARIKEGAALLQRHNIYWSAYFMIGLPSETADDIRETISFMRELRPSYSTLSVFTPYPGTELFDDVVDAGLASKDMDWSTNSHHSPYNYYTPNIPKAEFESLLAEAEEAFDAQNKRLDNIIAKVRGRSGIYLRDPRQVGTDAKRFLTWVGLIKGHESRK